MRTTTPGPRAPSPAPTAWKRRRRRTRTARGHSHRPDERDPADGPELASGRRPGTPGPVASHPTRLQDADAGQRPGAAAGAVVLHAAGLHPAHDGPLRKYLFHIVEELERPTCRPSSRCLPFVEAPSTPKPCPAPRAGMWQFMPATGKDYDLKQNFFRDVPAGRARVDARSPRLPAAAARNVRGLAPRAGSVQLGGGNVGRAVQRNQRAAATPATGTSPCRTRRATTPQAAGGEEHRPESGSVPRRAADDRQPPLFPVGHAAAGHGRGTGRQLAESRSRTSRR